MTRNDGTELSNRPSDADVGEVPQTPIHVLHVDDEPEFAELTATFLERTNDRFTVDTTSNAEEGLAAIDAAEYDCVVSDYDMPGLSGIEFLDVVRERYHDLPFILYTGKGSEEVASDAISAGVTDYLQKEMGTSQYEVLANRIQHAVDHWRVKRNEDEVRNRLEAITANSNDVILTIDAESRIRFVNSAVEDLFGYDPDDLIGEPLTVLMPPRYRDDHLQGVSRYLETGERMLDWQATEFPALHSDGYEIPVSISFSEFDLDGRQRFVGVIRDVSDRVRLEEELRDNVQLFHQMAENIPEVVWMSDPQKDEMFYVSPAYETIWQRPVESLYEDASSFLEAIHPEDRDRVKRALGGQAAGEYEEEYRIELPDGSIRWIHDRAVPVPNENDDVHRIVGIASDITERKEREQELKRVRDLLNRTERIADVGGWEIDTETTEVFWTENLFDILGVSRDGEPSLDEALDLYHEADRPDVESAVDNALENGEPFDIAARFRKPDGEIRWLRVRGQPTVAEGEVVSLRGAVQDITERKRTEQELKAQNERLEQFASVVSHDLRNPLNVAEGRLDLAREECDTDHLDGISDSLDRMDRIIEDMLWLAREGRDIGATEAVNLREAFQAAWSQVDNVDAEATLAIDLASGDEPTSIQANFDRLRQLLENLFRNAINHGGPGVTVSVGDLDDGFYVADDGPGIPAGDSDDVFEAGYTTDQEGTGFGLAIVDQIVRAHGWEITVIESGSGGARFDITGVLFEER